MKAAFLSDTHGYTSIFLTDLEEDPVDIVIHAGDFSNFGDPGEIESFNRWIDKLEGTRHLVFIGGNHDLGMEGVEPYHRVTPNGVEVHYLCDSAVEIDGIKIYGSPRTPEFFDWAFMYPRGSAEATEIWNKIPADTHTLVTHGPRYKILDQCKDINTWQLTNVGCKQLGERIDKLPQLKNHIFGHIHPAWGYKNFNGVNYYNVSMARDAGGFRKPIITEL